MPVEKEPTDENELSEENEPITQDTKKETQRLLIVAGVAAVIVLIMHYTPLERWMTDIRALKDQLDSYGWKAHACFIAGSVTAIALGVPRLGLCALGGFLFGALEGFFVSQIAGVSGSYAAFVMTRLWAPKTWIERKLAGNERLRTLLAKPDVANIFIARQMPVPGIVANVLLGVLPTRHRAFLLGTFLGYVPSNIPAAYFGSCLGKESLASALGSVTAGTFALGVFSALIVWIRRRYRD